jgi:gamma-glutamylcyclotransferase (GGCT)/AIG2-like uncharacterized protein YtfP
MELLFVYGTLLRGEDREGLVSQFDVRTAVTLGKLWRVPAGYPALQFSMEGKPIAGEVLTLDGPSVLSVLDLYEGVREGLYDRIRLPVQTDKGTEQAWAYVMSSTQLRRAGCVPLKVSDWRHYRRGRGA